MPEINITIAGLEENGFRQQSLRKEQDWAQSPLAKEPLEELPELGEETEGDQPALQRCQHHSALPVSCLAPQLPPPGHSSPAALFEQAALSCPELVFSSSPRGCRTQKRNNQAVHVHTHLT